jgi:formylglycine-generating enzyme required for sulfatase activity
MFRSCTLLLAVALPALAAVDFQTQVKPVLESQCLACHAPGRAAGGYTVHTRESLLKAVKPGEPAASKLVRLIELPPSQPGAMPPGGQMPEAQRAVIKQWIAEGAVWPDGVTLAMPKAKKLDEKQLVEALHQRITSRSREQSPADMKAYKESIPGTDVAFEMVPIPAGEFTMGTPETEAGRKPDEGPQHKVKLDPFWMGAREVTWDEYRLFMFAQQSGEASMADALVDAVARPTRPYVEMSFGMGINGFPAISMTHHAANKYAQWLSARTGHFYRLPTEAEWEYACRAGSTAAYSFGDDASTIGDYAWFVTNSDGKYQQVGKKKPNAWGLYDMHGNVLEWTLDQYAPYSAAGQTNPRVPSKTPYPHVARGGGWHEPASQLRCGTRTASDPSWKQQDPQLPKSIWYHTDAQWLGIRLVRPLKVPAVREMMEAWNNGVEVE